MIWDRKNKNIERNNEVRIVKIINALGETKYDVERFRVWGKYMNMWCTAKSNIDTHEEALVAKNEIEQKLLRNTIVDRNVL